ncbi:MAG: hypothetical protein LUH04_03755, partial [Clostridium sp.]|nr:hypothetical protein [Clostridium sp.]
SSTGAPAAWSSTTSSRVKLWGPGMRNNRTGQRTGRIVSRQRSGMRKAASTTRRSRNIFPESVGSGASRRRSTTAKAAGPDIRTAPRAAGPGGVARWTMVSVEK